MARKFCSAWLIVLLTSCLLPTSALLAADTDKPVPLDRDPGLMGWWTFDETGGKTAADASTHKRNGVLKGALSFEQNSAPGRTGKAIRLAGDDGYVEVAKYKGVTGTKPRTIAAWIKTAATQGEIVSWGSDDFGKMWIFGHVRGRVGVTPHGGYLYMNPETNDDKWHHVAVVVGEAELPNLYDDVKLYLDGTLAEIHDIGLLDLWPLETGNDLDVRIGRGFKGLIDDLRIYNRPLSDEEIETLFKLKSNQPTPKAAK